MENCRHTAHLNTFGITKYKKKKKDIQVKMLKSQVRSLNIKYASYCFDES